MSATTLTFDAVDEASPGPKWAARWARSWPAYETWFVARSGGASPSRAECEAALAHYMPELAPLHRRLTLLAGGSDRAARFLSTWRPPVYLGGCSIAAAARGETVRLVRNYDLSPELNEGLLLRSEWTGRAVMGMVEFLWGLSDGINDAGLSVALAYGGRAETGRGFGVTTILRYVLETCDTVEAALAVLRRVPSHMAYNVVLADAAGRTASVELHPGGGARIMPQAIATNHQGAGQADRPQFTRTFERHAHLKRLRRDPRKLRRAFLRPPLRQDRYGEGFGTLFTAEYDPKARALSLTMGDAQWDQSLERFSERREVADYGPARAPAQAIGHLPAAPHRDHHVPDWRAWTRIDWNEVARDYAAGQGRTMEAYLAAATPRPCCGDNSAASVMRSSEP
ncbi:hypothetical protein D6850_10860 [Roseovarius spongiae]|uniref:Peptidase C45 hydrolase domain-containing protein n=1 Tax=Roseovarius spongiae TaxID=2320272 RepID=A0A3A8AVX8_9RHOB|nr:C45 family peptidase [Roseovarius spongiae]RKF15318.1 hypothetical protein D6850_10860 [Roseovarius spongiae]